MYLQLLGDPYFQVSALESILSWLQDDTARVEDELLLRQTDAIDKLTRCFVHSKANSFENLLDPFLKMIRLSTSITLAISKSPAFFRRIVDRLQVGQGQQGGKTKAVVRLNLLRILRGVCDVHPNKAMLVERYGLLGVVEQLSRDGGEGGAVLVRELAREIVPALKPALRPSSSSTSTGNGTGSSNGAGSGCVVSPRTRGTGHGLMDFGSLLNQSESNSGTPPTSNPLSPTSSQSGEKERHLRHHHHPQHQRERKALAPKRLRRAASEASGTPVALLSQNGDLVGRSRVNANANVMNIRSDRERERGHAHALSGGKTRPVLSARPSSASSSSGQRQRLGDIPWQNVNANTMANESDERGNGG